MFLSLTLSFIAHSVCLFFMGSLGHRLTVVWYFRFHFFSEEGAGESSHVTGQTVVPLPPFFFSWHFSDR